MEYCRVVAMTITVKHNAIYFVLGSYSTVELLLRVV